jgi:hypothetical protein
MNGARATEIDFEVELDGTLGISEFRGKKKRSTRRWENGRGWIRIEWTCF